MLEPELASSWVKRFETPGIFRNATYNETQRRTLPWLGVVVQFNKNHLQTKRPASSPPDPRVARPIDPSHFNFSKAKQDEVVLRFATSRHGTLRPIWSASGGTLGAAVCGDEEEHTLFVNVNPLVDLHCLLVPCFPRCIDPQHLIPARLAPALLLASSVRRPDFRVGFNSLGAWATVNHMHWHVGCIGSFCEGNKLALERAERTVIHTNGPFSLALVQWPIRSMLFSLSPSADFSANVRALSEIVGSLCEEFAKQSIAHNLLISDYGRSVYVLPRKTQQGVAGEGTFNVALLEACGVAIVFNDGDFTSLYAETYRSIIADVSLPEEQFTSITAMAKQRMG